MLTETTDQPSPTQTTRVLHMVRSDSGTYRRNSRSQPTWCNRWASPREMAAHVDDVTCPACRTELDHFNELAF